MAGTPLKVAFIYNTAIEESAWTYSHELGRRYVQERLKGEIITKCYEKVTNAKIYEQVMEELEKKSLILSLQLVLIFI